jgi:hypothetical protein
VRTTVELPKEALALMIGSDSGESCVEHGTEPINIDQPARYETNNGADGISVTGGGEDHVIESGWLWEVIEAKNGQSAVSRRSVGGQSAPSEEAEPRTCSLVFSRTQSSVTVLSSSRTRALSSSVQ